MTNDLFNRWLAEYDGGFFPEPTPPLFVIVQEGLRNEADDEKTAYGPYSSRESAQAAADHAQRRLTFSRLVVMPVILPPFH